MRQKQEKAIDYKQKIKAIYNFYLDKLKNIEISEAENKHLRNYRNIIDYVKISFQELNKKTLSL